jgi:hypothetical protein
VKNLKAWTILGVAVAAPVVAAFSLPAYLEGARTDDVTRPGDEIEVHARLYDAKSRLLYSSAAADGDELARTKESFVGLFELPLVFKDSPMTYVLENFTRPVALDGNASVPLGRALLGKPVGYVAQFPVAGRFAGFEETLDLDRTRGPFNRTVQVTNSVLRNFTASEDRGPLASTIRVEVAEGDVLPVKQAGFDARVVVDEAVDRFSLILDAKPGHEFALPRGCKFMSYALPVGTYRVLAVDEDSIRLARSPTRWPQLIDRDLIIVLEIGKILGPKVTT